MVNTSSSPGPTSEQILANFSYSSGFLLSEMIISLSPSISISPATHDGNKKSWWCNKLWKRRTITARDLKYLERTLILNIKLGTLHLSKSEDDGAQQVLSLPDPPVHKPASISVWRVSHIFGHLSATRSKSPKPLNSSHSITPLVFLSADSTIDNKIILRARVCIETTIKVPTLGRCQELV